MLCKIYILSVSLFAGHHQQREISTGKESSDPDIAESIWSPWPKPAREQLRSSQHVVVHQPFPHGDRIWHTGLLAAQPLQWQQENKHIASTAAATDWKHTGAPWSISISLSLSLSPLILISILCFVPSKCPWTDDSWSLSSSTLLSLLPCCGEDNHFLLDTADKMRYWRWSLNCCYVTDLTRNMTSWCFVF